MSVKDLIGSITLLSENQDFQELVKRWCSTYDGKIIDLDLGEETYHIVFWPNGKIAVKEGLSTSFDLRLILSCKKTFFEILQGKKPMKEALKTGELKTWGNFHEAQTLESILRFFM